MQYLSIKSAIEEQITAGILKPEQKLPAERQLAAFFSTTRITLREALSTLEMEGKIYRKDRRGWFISGAPLLIDPASPLGFRDIALNQNLRLNSTALDKQTQLADGPVTEKLNLRSFSTVDKLVFLHCLDNTRVGYEIIYQNLGLCHGLNTMHEIKDSFCYQNEDEQKIHKINFELNTCALNGDAAHYLDASDGVLAIKLQKTRYDLTGNSIDVSISFWRSHAIKIVGNQAISPSCL